MTSLGMDLALDLVLDLVLDPCQNPSPVSLKLASGWVPGMYLPGTHPSAPPRVHPPHVLVHVRAPHPTAARSKEAVGLKSVAQLTWRPD